MEYREIQAEKEAYYKAYKKKLNEILEDSMLNYFKSVLFEIMKVARPTYILCHGTITKMIFDHESQDLIDKITIDRDKYIQEKYDI